MRPKIENAVSLYENGQLNKANDVCLEILKEQPHYFDALHLISLINLQSNKFQKAIELIDKAIKINSNEASPYNIKGVALYQLGQFNNAIEYFNKAINVKSDFFEAYLNRGNSLKELNQLNSAIKNYDKAIKHKPNYSEAYNNRGLVELELKQINVAIKSFDKAIEFKSNYSHAYNNRGNALLELKLIDDAIKNYDKAIIIEDKFFEAYYNRGIALNEIKKFNAAIENYNKVIEIEPNYVNAYLNKGNSLRRLKLFDLALKSYEKAMKINPNLDFLLGTLIFTKKNLCDWSFLDKYKNILKKKIFKQKKVSLPYDLLSLYDSLAIHKSSSEIYVKDKFPSINTLGTIPKRIINKKIRIGYYSADYYEHATSFLIAELIEVHDKSKFEIFGFSFGPNKNDEMKKRISNAFDDFIDVNLKTDKEVAQLSRDLKIDIAVDLKCFTQFSRFGIFVERCAPIQVNYLGYPGTSGANCIDYIIADKVLIPQENQKYYSEKIVYLPHCYQVNDSTKKISDNIFTREELELPKDGFIFCCFNNNYKITPNVFDSWMKILKNVKDSVLWLFDTNPLVIKNLQQEANQRAIKSDRLIFAKPMTLDKHLARLRVADLFLDTLPYNAHTTCSDALWSGLPMIGRIGQSFQSRVSASLLTAIELPELITSSEKEYEDLAIKLATNPDQFVKIKNKLKKNRLQTPLFNTKLFTKNIETAYIKMNEKFQSDLKPANIEVE